MQAFANEVIRCIHSDGKIYYSILLKILYEYYKLETEQPQQQTEKKAKAASKHEAAKNEKTAEGVDMTAAPADGLELVEIAEGVAVVGDQRTTYKNRKQIKAHGAKWNKEAQQWQATTAEAVSALREWFGMTEQTAQDSAKTAAEETATEANTCEQVEAVGALASALSFLLNAVISASKEAKAAADQAAATAAEATAHDAAAEREQKRKEAAAILREQIAKVSEQVANLSGTLSQMLERLNILESGQDVSEKAAEPKPGNGKAA